VRARRQRGEEALEILVQQRVAADLLVELAELVGRRQLSIDQQPGDLEEARVRGELLDEVIFDFVDAVFTNP
jgi:hypothetical protein